MSCDRRCYDANSANYNHDDCETCPGQDSGLKHVRVRRDPSHVEEVGYIPNENEENMCDFKVGDWVKPNGYDPALPPYEVKEIYSDGFGDVLLREPGGYGFGAQYCVKVEAPNAEITGSAPLRSPRGTMG